MNLLKQSAIAWKEITEYRYIITYGYKRQLTQINLFFSLEDFPHLAGFQYLNDIPLPNYNYSKIIDQILEEKISYNDVQKSSNYNEMIRPRLDALIHIKDALDSDFNLFTYTPQYYPFHTSLKANYIISSHVNIQSFTFIIESSSPVPKSHNYICCSIFSKGKRDYEINQRKRIILKKECIHLTNNESTILLDKINPLNIL